MIQWIKWLRIVFLFEASAAKRLRKDLKKIAKRAMVGR